MCGRYTLTFTLQEAVEAFNVTKVKSEFRMNYNVSPTQDVPVIILEENEVVLDNFRWGFIPHWAKDDKLGYKMINARAETIAEKPSFKGAFLNHRCLIPASGFFEWQQTKTQKIPHYMKLKDRKIFAFAGISSQWKPEDGDPINSFSIVTTQANDFMEGIHDRMPVILPKNMERLWLDNSNTDKDALKNVLVPYPSDKMQKQIVSSLVNSPKNNTKDVLEPSQGFLQSLDRWV